MQVHPYVEQVQVQLSAAAALGDERARDVAAALVRATEPAIRLAVLAAISAAADEITAALLDTPGTPTVTVRTDGDELRVDVRTTETPEPIGVSAPAADDAEASARISLRLSESLKADIETAARGSRVSVNTWLVRAASTALSGATARAGSAGTTPPRNLGGHRVTGWING